MLKGQNNFPPENPFCRDLSNTHFLSDSGGVSEKNIFGRCQLSKKVSNPLSAYLQLSKIPKNLRKWRLWRLKNLYFNFFAIVPLPEPNEMTIDLVLGKLEKVNSTSVKHAYNI